MNLEDIKVKKQKASDSFTELQQQRTQIEEELLRLQGEWRTLDALEQEQTDPATTVTAKEDKKNGK